MEAIEKKDIDKSLYVNVNGEYISFKTFIERFVSETDPERATNGELQDFRDASIGHTMQLAGQTVTKVLDYKIAIHYLPSHENHNVRCLNGSAHIKRTHNINEVTCELCKNPETNKPYWLVGMFFNKH